MLGGNCLKLCLNDICVELSGKNILKNINLEVQEGQFISLLGASGCGKSTLLKTIAGIINQSKGNIYLDGKDANQIPSHKRGTVIVFQDLRLFPHMNVLENIYFSLKMKGIPKNEYISIAEEFLDKVQLSGFETRKIKELSGGQMQRVALARALAAKPNILLLDEPFSSLDENLREDMRQLLLNLQREYKITTVLVTHDRYEALALSDKIAVMKDGEILQYDTPEKIYKNPKNKIVADYFGDNIYLSGIVEDNIFKNDILEFETNKKNGNYSIMFRNKDIKIIKACDLGNAIVENIFFKGNGYEILIRSTTENLAFRLKLNSEHAYNIGEKILLEFDTKNSIFF